MLSRYSIPLIGWTIKSLNPVGGFFSIISRVAFKARTLVLRNTSVFRSDSVWWCHQTHGLYSHEWTHRCRPLWTCVSFKRNSICRSNFPSCTHNMRAHAFSLSSHRSLLRQQWNKVGGWVGESQRLTVGINSDAFADITANKPTAFKKITFKHTPRWRSSTFYSYVGDCVCVYEFLIAVA